MDPLQHLVMAQAALGNGCTRASCGLMCEVIGGDQEARL